jgi:hypothetical protein
VLAAVQVMSVQIQTPWSAPLAVETLFPMPYAKTLLVLPAHQSLRMLAVLVEYAELKLPSQCMLGGGTLQVGQSECAFDACESQTPNTVACCHVGECVDIPLLSCIQNDGTPTVGQTCAEAICE